MLKTKKSFFSKTIFIVSLHQIIGPKSMNSVSYLSNILLKKSPLRYLPYLGNLIAYYQMKIHLSLIEPILYGTIDDYREGKITTEQFFKKSLTEFSDKFNKETIEKSLKSSCKLDRKTLEHLIELVILYEEKKNKSQIILAITCDLIPIQYNYVLEQINSALIEKGLKSLNFSTRIKEDHYSNYEYQRQTAEDFILIETSHQTGELEETSLASSLIHRYNLDSENNLIIALNNNFTKENTGVQRAFFSNQYMNSPEFWFKNIKRYLFKDQIDTESINSPKSPISFTGPKFSGNSDRFTTYGK